MAVTIKWKDNSYLEKGHRIYKSSTYFTPDNLPAPLVDLSPNIEEYQDTTSNAGENWYIVSAYILGYEVFSEPFIPSLTTTLIHDIFGDGSAVATYNFDGDITDLGGNYNGTWTGTENYASGIISQAVYFNSSSIVDLNVPFGGAFMSISVWLKYDYSSQNEFATLFYTSTGTTLNGTSPAIMTDTDGLGINTGNGDMVGVSTNVLPQNTWFHLYIYFDNNDSNNLIYIDGVSRSTSSQKQTPGTRSMNTDNRLRRIGGSTDTYFYKGSMDQLRIFNRALTQEEVNDLYQEGQQ